VRTGSVLYRPHRDPRRVPNAKPQGRRRKREHTDISLPAMRSIGSGNGLTARYGELGARKSWETNTSVYDHWWQTDNALHHRRQNPAGLEGATRSKVGSPTVPMPRLWTRTNPEQKQANKQLQARLGSKARSSYAPAPRHAARPCGMPRTGFAKLPSPRIRGNYENRRCRGNR